MQGILLVNLGSPQSPTRSAIRAYLKEFLSDRRVVDKPIWQWWPILYGIILNTRPTRLIPAYRKIWTEEGAPLLVHSRNQAKALQDYLGPDYAVAWAMRYGYPNIAQGLEQIKFCHSIRILPLYPQYSATTTASVFDAVFDELKRWRFIPQLNLINHYFESKAYIQALAQSIRDFQAKAGRPDKLLISFHGIPQSYAEAGDPYPQHCQQTAEKLAQSLGLSDSDWSLSYQSRLGRQAWLQPYTSQILRHWATQGVKKVQVICPGFAADCLETLEEIAIENRHLFLQSGGKRYDYIPCLNDRPDHIQALAKLLQ